MKEDKQSAFEKLTAEALESDEACEAFWEGLRLGMTSSGIPHNTLVDWQTLKRLHPEAAEQIKALQGEYLGLLLAIFEPTAPVGMMLEDYASTVCAEVRRRRRAMALPLKELARIVSEVADES